VKKVFILLFTVIFWCAPFTEVLAASNTSVIKNEENKQIYQLYDDQATNDSQILEQAVSKLGHILDPTARIYKTIGIESTSFAAGTEYTDKVFYIKKQADLAGQKFYLLSTVASATTGVVGWIKAQDIWAQDHVSVSHESKTYYLKGTGWAYTDPWGAGQDTIYRDLQPFQYQTFKVNLTEKVGNALWHRGYLENGKKVWIQDYNLTSVKVTPKESATSKLGHILDPTARIYKTIGIESTSFAAGTEYTDKVFYIKKQIDLAGQKFYLLSTVASATTGVVGWIKAQDIWAQDHVSVSHESKTYYLKGTGWAYTDPWGAGQDTIYRDLQPFQYQTFKVNLTEKVGNALWHRGYLENGKKVWIQDYNLIDSGTVQKYTPYNITLNQALQMQMKVDPITYNPYGYVFADYIVNGIVTLNDGKLNVRKGPGTDYDSIGSLTNGTKVKILDKVNDWDVIEFYSSSLVVATPKETLYYLDPNNFKNDPIQVFQFLDLTKPSMAPAEVLNKVLLNKGTLSGQGQAFIEASKTYGINDVYLIAHAFLETNKGTSELAKGVVYNGKKVYNMYGIGAFDNDPIKSGAKFAYDHGWTDPAKAIIGGAEFIGNDYIKAGQNTLYKMRWNPEYMDKNGGAGHQYATDVAWATKQVNTMYNIYSQMDSYLLYLDIPKYK
jgi:bifunctional autolysin